MRGVAATAAIALVTVVGVTSAGASTKAPHVTTSGRTAGVAFTGAVTCTFAGTALSKVAVASPKVSARKVWGTQKVQLVAQLQVLKKGTWKVVGTQQHTSTVRTKASTLPALKAFTSGVSPSLRSLRVVEAVHWLRPADGKEEGTAKVTVSKTCVVPVPSPSPLTSVVPTTVPTMDPSMPGMSMAPTTAAASPTDSPSPSPSPLPAPVTTFHISGFAFSTQAGTIHAGDTVAVVNDDSVTHTFTLSLGGSQVYDSGNLSHGGTTSFVAPATGTYAISCDIHSDMHGTLTVS